MSNATANPERTKEDLVKLDPRETQTELEILTVERVEAVSAPARGFRIASLQHWLDLCG